MTEEKLIKAISIRSSIEDCKQALEELPILEDGILHSIDKIVAKQIISEYTMTDVRDYISFAMSAMRKDMTETLTNLTRKFDAL